MKKSTYFYRGLIQIVLMLWGILQIYPIVLVIISSLRTTSEIITDPLGLPKTLYLSNYIFTEFDWPIGIFFRNSILITTFSLIGILAVACLAGYAIAKIKFDGKNIVLFVFILFLGVPIHSIVIPLYIYMRDFGLINRYLGLILPYIALNLSFSTLTLQAYFREFPDELIEAGKIDGCNNFTVFFRIVLPSNLGIFSSIAIMNFIFVWNEFVWAMIMMKNRGSKTLIVGLQEFRGLYSTDWGKIYAAMVIIILPTILVYFIFHKYIVKGIGAGAVKG